MNPRYYDIQFIKKILSWTLAKHEVCLHSSAFDNKDYISKHHSLSNKTKGNKIPH
jgi:hypothetical protein